jgi:putative sigma-54 modulation protein
MEIRVHSVHFTADQKLIDFINEKVSKLGLFYDNIIAADVYLKLDKEHAFDNKISELKVLIPGKELFAHKQCNSFEEAVDLAVEALRKQVMKQKERIA